MNNKTTKRRRRRIRFTVGFWNKVVALFLTVGTIIIYKHTGYGEILAFMFWPIIYMTLTNEDILGLCSEEEG